MIYKKTEISILSHTAKKLQALQFLQNLLSKKCLGKTGQFYPKLF